MNETTQAEIIFIGVMLLASLVFILFIPMIGHYVMKYLDRRRK